MTLAFIGIFLIFCNPIPARVSRYIQSNEADIILFQTAYVKSGWNYHRGFVTHPIHSCVSNAFWYQNFCNSRMLQHSCYCTCHNCALYKSGEAPSFFECMRWRVNVGTWEKEGQLTVVMKSTLNHFTLSLPSSYPSLCLSSNFLPPGYVSFRTGDNKRPAYNRVCGMHFLCGVEWLTDCPLCVWN